MVAGEGRGGVKLREGSQTPMVVGESGGNLPRAAGDETLSKEQRRFLGGLPNTDRRQKRTQKWELSYCHKANVSSILRKTSKGTRFCL